jgi:hypothetical protein
VEQRVAQQAAHRERHHDRQRRRVDVGRAEREQEVGRPRDVERREERVDGRVRGREEVGEEPRGEGGGVGGVVGGFGVGELRDDGAFLLGGGGWLVWVVGELGGGTDLELGVEVGKGQVF